MKMLILGLLTFISLNSFSAECVIQGIIVSKRGSDQYLDRSTTRKRINVNKWESCYLKAIEIAKTRVFTQKGVKPYLVFGDVWKWKNLEVSQTIIFKWKFDDSFFNDSQGLVSKYSSEENPSLGDNAVDENGYYIKD